MPTWGDIADDVLVTLGYTHDDAVRNVPNVMFNMALVVDRLKRLRIEKELGSGYGSRGASRMSTTFIVPLFEEDYVNGRMYFKLPSEVYDIQMNGGIEYIAYHRESGCQDNLVGLHFTQASPAEADLLAGSEMQRPSSANPYYFRARINTGTNTFADRVWLLGVSPMIKSVEVGLYLTVGDLDNLDPDAEANIPADMVYLVKRHLLDLERWVLLTPQQRLTNDGRDFKEGQQPFQPPPAVSVNDPSLNIEL